MSIKGVTDIITRLRSEVQDYLDELIDAGTPHRRLLGWSNDYPAEIRCHPNRKRHFGTFQDYVIRREIDLRCNTKITDDRAELCKAAFEKYKQLAEEQQEFAFVQDGKRVIIRSTDKPKLEKLLKSYEIFKDRKVPTHETKTLEHIFNTSMLHMFSYGNDTLEFQPEFIYDLNIDDMLSCVRNLILDTKALTNPSVKGKFFQGEADLLFEDSIMELKTSSWDYKDDYNDDKHPDGYKQDENFRRAIYQMIFYALGIFYKFGREIRILKIFNPLRGVLYELQLPEELDFEELRLKIDNEPPYKQDFKQPQNSNYLDLSELKNCLTETQELGTVDNMVEIDELGDGLQNVDIRGIVSKFQGFRDGCSSKSDVKCRYSFYLRNNKGKMIYVVALNDLAKQKYPPIQNDIVVIVTRVNIHRNQFDYNGVELRAVLTKNSKIIVVTDEKIAKEAKYTPAQAEEYEQFVNGTSTSLEIQEFDETNIAELLADAEGELAKHLKEDERRRRRRIRLEYEISHLKSLCCNIRPSSSQPTTSNHQSSIPTCSTPRSAP